MKQLIKLSTILLLWSSLVFAENYSQEKTAILVKPESPEFTVQLKSNATTGYEWFLRSYDNHVITPVSHHYQRPTSQLVGAPGFEVWTFRVKAEGFTVPQVTYIRFVYARPWEAQSQAGQQVEFKVTTVSK